MKSNVLRTIVFVIPILMLVLIYGILVQQSLIWSVVVVIGILSIVGLALVVTTESHTARRASFAQILLSSGIGASVMLLGLVLYQYVVQGVVEWPKYAALFMGFMLVPIVFVVLKQLWSKNR